MKTTISSGNCTDENSLMSGALELVRLGCPVIPLHGIRDGHCTCGDRKGCHPGKHPHIKAPSRRASTDEAQIIEWWEDWPDANVGMPTGKAFGRFVLDVDHGKGGGESLKTLVMKNGKLPVTQTGLTGGGYHYHFSYPEDLQISNSVSTVGAGLDIRADRGLVVAPPSRHVSGRMYRWEQGPGEAPLGHAPDWLLEKIVSPVSGGNGSVDPGTEIGLFECLILEGYRNETLFRSYACHLRDKGLSMPYVREICLAMNAHKCHPPLPEREVNTLVRSAFTYPKRPSRLYDISPSAKKVFQWLLMKAGGRPCWKGAVNDIAAEVGVSDRHVRRCIHQLEEFKKIRTQEVAGKTSIYELLPSVPRE